ncbi:MAG: ion channel [Boseongicola sp.]
MFVQLFLGGVLILTTVIIATLAWWALEAMLARLHNWYVRPPYGPKLMLVLLLALVWTLLLMTVAVWVWAVALYLLEIFVVFEASIYFALVAFTTLGFGDILLPQEWRLLGGMAAANGLLMFGLLTAVLVEIIRDTRSRQRAIPRR